MQLFADETPLVRTPSIATLPPKARQTLLDQGLLAFEASQAGFSERYRRGETPHTIHVWWARRPHSAMRALVYASLTCDTSADTYTAMADLCSGSLPSPMALAAARSAISSQFTEPPKVLDMFGGGGTIPFEASLLGAESHSIDCNELSVFLQKCLLAPTAVEKSKLPALIRESGERVLDRLAKKTAPLYPQRGKVFGYLWTYSYPCSGCGYRFLLSKRPWLSKKKGKRLALVTRKGTDGDATAIETVGEDYESPTPWAGRNGTAICPKCQHTHKGISIKGAVDELVGLVAFAERTGKEFLPPADDATVSPKTIQRLEADALKAIGAELPASTLPRWSGIVNPALYGIETHADFLNPRQRAVLAMLIRELRDEYDTLAVKHGEETAFAATGILSGLLDQQVDWNCRLSMWISQNEQVGRAFSGPGVAMLWDYIETDPALEGPANLRSKLDRIVEGAKTVCSLTNPVNVQKGYAQALPFPDGTFHAIVTDPPYYDNVYYSVLADFFYSWKRLLFEPIAPELFPSGRTDESRELVASTFRAGSADLAHEQYCTELRKAVGEAERVLRDDGIFSLVFSHSSIRGWQSLMQAYRASSLTITSVQPLSIERKARPRAMTSDAVNTCMVFVAHKSKVKKKKATSKELEATFRSIISPIVTTLRESGWSDEDIAIAAFAQAVGLLANVSGCSDADDTAALRLMEAAVQESIPQFRVTGRGSL